MTPTPEGFKIIPREWLEAGNPLPEDALCQVMNGWQPSDYAGEPVPSVYIRRNTYATAQPLPCFQKGGDEPCAQSQSEALTPHSTNQSKVSSTDTEPMASTDSSPSGSASNAPVAVPSPDQGPEQRCTNHFSDGSKIFPNRDCCKEPERVAPETEQASEPCNTGDVAETIERNPKSWAAWKREAERLGERIAELEREKKALVKQLDFVAKNEGGGALLVSDIYDAAMKEAK